MHEYRIKITVRNNLLMSAIEAAGFKSQSEFCRSAGIDIGSFNELVTMQKPPITENGSFTHAAKGAMEALGAAPTDLWTANQLNMSLKRNSSEFTLSADDIAMMLGHKSTEPDALFIENQTSEILNELVGLLSDKSQAVIRGIYGFEEKGQKEIASETGVSRIRINQRHLNSLMKLRCYARKNALHHLVT